MLLDVDSSKICHIRPKNVMENAAFIGAFENRGSSARVFLIHEGDIVESRCSKGTKAAKQELQTGEYLVRNVFEWHRKYKDFSRTSTVITRWDGDELPLGLMQFTFAADKHHISPHKHPRSGKQFVPTAPSTKAKLLKEASG